MKGEAVTNDQAKVRPASNVRPLRPEQKREVEQLLRLAAAAGVPGRI